MDHPLNGNLRAPEDHLRGLSTEIVDDVVVKIARALHSGATFRYLRLNKLVIHIRFHKYSRDINNTIKFSTYEITSINILIEKKVKCNKIIF